MDKTTKNVLTVFAILFATAFLIYYLPTTGYLRPVDSDDIVGWQPSFIAVFLIADLILIGIPVWIHRVYVKDYGPIHSVRFFAILGGVLGATLGEVLPTMNPQNFILIISYTLLCWIYAQFYKRFTWWKVALTTYLGGMMVENVMNRSPMQIPTLLWVAFFTYPYFWTKIWENREKVSVTSMVGSILLFMINLRWHALASLILMALAYYIGIFTSGQVSPPLVVMGLVLPFLIKFLHSSLKALASLLSDLWK